MSLSNQLKVSVVIPAYNSSQRIHIPLERLILQNVDDESFEIIVIDNASTDGTGEIATNYWKTNASSRNISFRVVREEKKGLVHARIRGVIESRFPIVCFLDDDNVPENNDYIIAGISEFTDESIGLLTSRIFPDFQSKITASIQKREHLLAINNKLGDKRIEWEPCASLCPSIGAGMWLRREVFLSAFPWKNPQALLTDRIGNSLVSGGDIEIGYFIGKAGFKRVYSPSLRLKHIIPDSRLNTSYFCRLINGVVRSTLTLELKYNHQKFGFLYKVGVLTELLAVLVFAPVIIFLSSPDGVREFLFVISARWAKVQGSYFNEQPDR